MQMFCIIRIIGTKESRGSLPGEGTNQLDHQDHNIHGDLELEELPHIQVDCSSSHETLQNSDSSFFASLDDILNTFSERVFNSKDTNKRKVLFKDFFNLNT